MAQFRIPRHFILKLPLVKSMTQTNGFCHHNTQVLSPTSYTQSEFRDHIRTPDMPCKAMTQSGEF